MTFSRVVVLYLTVLLAPGICLVLPKPLSQLKEYPIDVSRVPGMSDRNDCTVRCSGLQCSLRCERRVQGCEATYSAPCCNTCKTFIAAPWGIPSNLYTNQIVYPVNPHWDFQWQLIPVGTCESHDICGRGGRCREQIHAVPIFVADRPLYSAEDLCEANTWYEFHPFPSHCQCEKSTTSLLGPLHEPEKHTPVRRGSTGPT